MRQMKIRNLAGKALGAAFSLGLMFSPATAGASIKVLQSTYPDGTAAPAELYLSGEITTSTKQEMLAALDQIGRKVPMLYLDSAGGDLVAGMELGEAIRRRGINTSIGKSSGNYGKPLPGICYSACVLTFSGGHFRFADQNARIGIHRFYRRTTSTSDLDVGQVVSAAITSYLIRMGVSPLLFEKMAQVGGGKMQLLPISEASGLSLVNNGILSPQWGIEGKQGTVYLKGERNLERYRQADRHLRESQRRQDFRSIRCRHQQPRDFAECAELHPEGEQPVSPHPSSAIRSQDQW